MKAMILAAGLATRLRPLTNDLPKALLPVAGRPLIHYTLLLLKRYGITDVIINLHHQGKKIADSLGDGAELGMRIRYSWEPAILGTGGGIKHAGEFLAGGAFLLINGDILIDLNLDKLAEYHHRRKATVSMVLRADPDAAAYGAIEIDEQDRVRRILGRGSQTGGPLRQYMFTGTHILEPSVLEWIPGGGFSSITDIYIAMLLRNEKL
ncbi:MAG: nucleotidyltransferase family protein, partial [Nitrospirota bacterium]